MPLDDYCRAGVHVPGARVIAETRPEAQHIIETGGREPVDRRPPREKARIVGADGLDRGLLQHDLGKPDAVGIGPFAAQRAPWLQAPRQYAGVPVVPGEQISGRGRGPFLSPRHADCYVHGATMA